MTQRLCFLHEDNEPEHWTGTAVGVKTLNCGVWTGDVVAADLFCAKHNNIEAERIVDESEITVGCGV